MSFYISIWVLLPAFMPQNTLESKVGSAIDYFIYGFDFDAPNNCARVVKPVDCVGYGSLAFYAEAFDIFAACI